MRDIAAAIEVMQPVALTFAAILLGIASLNDIATRTIPDRASLGLVLIGAALRLADGSALAALAASVVIFLLAGACWRFGWLGGGDVKLLAAATWIVSPALVPQLVLTTALAGGVLACVYLALSLPARTARAPAPTAPPQTLAARILRVEWRRIKRRAALPYGCAIAAATLLTLSGG